MLQYAIAGLVLGSICVCSGLSRASAGQVLLSGHDTANTSLTSLRRALGRRDTSRGLAAGRQHGRTSGSWITLYANGGFEICNP